MIWTTRPRSDFGKLRAIQAGNGATVLLIHGVGLRAEAWAAQIDMLCAEFRVIAVDMPGHGESALPARAAELPDYTDALAVGLDGPAVVVGHSMGAMIALNLAVRYPHLVRGVAALNAIYQRSDAARIAVQARAASLGSKSVSDPAPTLARWFGDTPSQAREACQTWLTEVDPTGYRVAYTVFARENGPNAQALASLSCPALFLTGGQEPNSTPQMSEAMAKLTPRGKARIIKGAAHMMPMTHAGQVNAALSEFAKGICCDD